MCKCKNIEIGTYENTVTRIAPDFMLPLKNIFGEIKKPYICLDKCIEDEIKFLWKHKIYTVGCCCGHNKLQGYIQVKEEHIQDMINLGYVNDGVNNNSFISKTK